MPQSRQLAAIMFTDIVGYTALMGKDEQKAFDLLHKNREIQKPLIKQFHGTWIKELGDGVLASFHTVTDAVFCAARLHQACNLIEGLKLRIGIHLGEVIFENNDVFGDGVNIASRLQALAASGSTWVSEAVHKNLTNKKEISSEFIKEERLKNVSEPVKVYEITVKEIPGYFPDNIKTYQEKRVNKPADRKKIYFAVAGILLVLTAAFFLILNKQSKFGKADNKILEKSIAVLPFVNMSNDSTQEYFSDGITEDIITRVSKISDLKVISRTAVMQYKLTKKTVQQISEELNVATILEGSVRRDGNQVRIVAQLIDAKTNEHLWADTYDKELTQIFEIQSNVAEQIAAALQAKFSRPGREGSEKKLTESPEAYDFYLRGKFYFNEQTLQSTDTAILLFERAVSTDPKFALGYAALALAYTEKFFNYTPDKKWREQAFVALEKALSLDPDLPEAYLARATLIWIPENHFPHELAVAEVKRAISLQPNFAEARRYLSSIYSHIGLHQKAFEQVHIALTLNPHDPETLTQASHQYYYNQKFTEMLDVAQKVPKDYGKPFGAARNAEVLLRIGKTNEANTQISDLLNEYPDHSYLISVHALYLALAGKSVEAEQKIQKAIISGKKFGHFHHTTYNIGAAYALMNKHAEAIHWLKTTAEDGLPCYTFFANDRYLDNLRKDDAFRLLLVKLKKQWEGFNATL